MAPHTGQKMGDTLRAFKDGGDKAKRALADAAIGLLGLREDFVAVEKTSSQWSRLQEHVAEIAAVVLESLPADTGKEERLARCIEALTKSITAIQVAYEEQKASHGDAKRFLRQRQNAAEVTAFRQEFDDRFEALKLTLALDHKKVMEVCLGSLGANLSTLTQADVGDIKARVGDIKAKTDSFQPAVQDVVRSTTEGIIPAVVSSNICTATRETLKTLPYMQGASWVSTNVCMSGTREEVLETTWAWIKMADASKPAEIFWLSGVAGSGKTTIANSISQRASTEGWLLTTIFFDRTSDERNKPNKFVTTLARDLAAKVTGVAKIVAAAMDAEVSLASTPDLIRQFEKLILPASTLCRRDRPNVIIIDALDEGCDKRILELCVDYIPALPGNFRIFITSRPDSVVTSAFKGNMHIINHLLAVRDRSTLAGVELFLSKRLGDVARRKNLGAGWPDVSEKQQLVQKAEGLFLWASVAMNHLESCSKPKKQLSIILSLRGALNVEQQMDALYETVLQACPWDIDPDFADGYALYMGTVIAVKEALPLRAIALLHKADESEVLDVFGHLGSLVTGLYDTGETIQIIHLSFRDYVIARAPHSLRLSIKEGSRRLALPCVRVLIEYLGSDKAKALGIFDQPLQAPIPIIASDTIPQAVYYTCRFWVDHVLDVDQAGPDLLAALSELLNDGGVRRLVHLAVALEGGYRGLGTLWSWLAMQQERVASRICTTEIALWFESLSRLLQDCGRWPASLNAAEDAVAIMRFVAGTETEAELAWCLNSWALRLSDVGRREAALEAIEEAVVLYRNVAEERPAAFSAVLAISLNIWSHRLFDVGSREAALEVVEEALVLYRKLAEEDPAAFNSDLASCLNSWAIRLSDLGRHEAALEAVEEAVALRRKLAEERPAAFSDDLAHSLNNWSLELSELGRYEAALEAVEEAVALRRTLAEEQPAAFTAALAISLDTWSHRLSDLGRHETALEAVEEVVALRRKLAEERPATYNSDLASSLNNWALRLSDLGRHEAALDAVEEAVALRRQLVQERPATFSSDLANSLNNWAIRLFNLGRHEAALKAAEEAVALCRKLAKELPATFSSDLASSLSNWAVRLSDLGHHEAAFDAIEESVALYRKLAEERPAAFNADLAISLYGLFDVLSASDRHEDAMKAVEEAAALFRILAEEHPNLFTWHLAIALENCSATLSKLGHYQAASEVADEAKSARSLDSR